MPKMGDLVAYVANASPTVNNRRGQRGNVRNLTPLPALVMRSRVIRNREVLALWVFSRYEAYPAEVVPPFDPLKPRPNTWRPLP